jgi:hypothetical protein
VIFPHREHQAAGARASAGWVSAPQPERRQMSRDCFSESDTIHILRCNARAVSGIRAREARHRSVRDEAKLSRGCVYAAFSSMVTANPRASIRRWSRFASVAGS